MPPVRIRACAAAALLGLAAAQGAGAQAFPSRTVRYIMPLPPGGETDTFGRVLAKHLTDAWGQQVVVENRPGGGTTIATEVTAKAPPDGHAFMHAITPFGVNATLYPKLSYDTLKDFACVTYIGNLYGVLLAHPSFPVKSVADLVKLAKARPGEITFATGGAGTANHITIEALRAAAGINIVHVPYKGTSLAVHDVVPGRVPLLGTILVEALPYIQSGRLRVVATTNPKRAPSLPDVPTVGETLPKYQGANGFWAIVTGGGARQAERRHREGLAGAGRAHPARRGRRRDHCLASGAVRRLYPRAGRRVGRHGQDLGGAGGLNIR
jgi:tripartite-type tricarboxylate transporter receptor subunit TctC